MAGRGHNRERIETAKQQVADSGHRFAEMERAHRRLQHLYDISALLTRFRSVEGTLSEVVAVLAQTLSLRSAIFIIETAGPPHTIVWQVEGEDPSRLAAAKARAQTAYRYLVRPTVDLAPETDAPLRLPRRPENDISGEGQPKQDFVILPLVVEHESIFGALQIEAAAGLDETDLVFVNTVVNQLAIAIDRHAAVTSKQEGAEEREREQRVLAGVSAVLSSSFENGQVLTALAHFVVPSLADLCLVDEVGEDGTTQRRAVLFADERKQRDLAERLTPFAPQAGWQTPQAGVIASGKPLLIRNMADPAPQNIAQNEDHADVIRATGMQSMMAVPLFARGRILGVLTLCAGESGRHYSMRDLALVEEVGFRTAMAMDNARLYQHTQSAMTARENLLAIVSHDLRNPLSVILMNLHALLRIHEGGERRQQSRAQLSTIQRSAEWMTRLIEDLLDTATIEAGHLAVDSRQFDAARVVDDAVAAVQSQAAGKSVHLESDLPPHLPAVRADDMRVQQVLVNLLVNAIKFTPAGGSITVRGTVSGHFVTISVTDTGPGIPKEDLPHLFGRFWQAKRYARIGTGLGLFIVKGIVEAHGGRVWVESKVDEGSTFFFTIPTAELATESPLEKATLRASG